MKEKCINHPNIEALSFCHSCGKHFCRDCLKEGKEYYYCYNETCQSQLEKEINLVNKSEAQEIEKQKEAQKIENDKIEKQIKTQLPFIVIAFVIIVIIDSIYSISGYSAFEWILSFIITWVIGLLPPLLIRFVFIKRSIAKKPAIAICILFLLFNISLFTYLESTNKSHAVLYLIAYISYWILRKGKSVR